MCETSSSLQSGAQTGRTCANDGHPLGIDTRQGLPGHLGLLVAVISQFPIGDKAFELSDGKRLIDLIATAFSFTGMCTNSAADTRKGYSFPNQIDGFLKTPIRNKGHITLNVNTGRAGIRTGGYPRFIDNRTLRLDTVQTVDGFVLGFRHRYRTDIDAIPTARAGGKIHEAGTLDKLQLKRIFVACSVLEIRVGPQGNAGMFGDF